MTGIGLLFYMLGEFGCTILMSKYGILHHAFYSLSLKFIITYKKLNMVRLNRILEAIMHYRMVT